MSNNNSSISYSSSSASSNGQASGRRETHTSYTNESGTTTRSVTQNLGEPIVQQTRNYDSQGRELVGNGHASTERIQDVSAQEQTKLDQLYEERMEDEYAKREGGA